MSTGAPAAYKVVDRSLLLPYYKRYLVEPLLPLLPRSLHPNTITHFGHLINLSGAVMLVALWPKQGWPFVLSIVLLQTYLWCDHADGAHARRTNQCSALGEFLDHGLDSLNMIYISYVTSMALGAPPFYWVAVALLIPGAGGVTYWEQAQTGVFRLGLLNQIESVLVLSTALMVSAVLGNQIWGAISLFGITLQKAMIYWSLGTIVFGIARNMQRVAMRDGLRALPPVLGVIAFGVAILEGARVEALSTVTAVTLATAINVYFSTRMLTFRLLGRAPKVEPVVWAFTAAVAGLILARRLDYPVGPMVGPAIAALACVVFGAHAIIDARASVIRVTQVEAREG
ncbi:MAG: CDP-alcohol phosphatidyltransferase family protein [Byssovorax sp.]